MHVILLEEENMKGRVGAEEYEHRSEDNVKNDQVVYFCKHCNEPQFLLAVEL